MDGMNHTTKPGWFYAYGYNWRSIDPRSCGQVMGRQAVEEHFTLPFNRERAKNIHGLACECSYCLAGIRLVNKGWRPDKS